MLKKPKALALTLATMLAAGCAHSDQSAMMGPVKWKRGKAPDYSRAKLAPEPKILPQTYFAAGQLLEQQGQYAKAANQYRRATAVNHKFVAAYHQLGLVLTKMGAFDEATQSLTKAAKMAPKNALIRNNLGFALMLQQRWPEAAEQFQRCIELHPEFSRAHINLGMTLAKMDRFDEAYESFRAVLAEPDAYYNLGLMYRARGQFDDAAGAFRNALAVNPDFYAASVQLQNVESSALAMNTTTGETVRPIRLGAPKASQQALTEVQTIDTEPMTTTTPRPRLINLEEQVDDTPTMAPKGQTIGSMQPAETRTPATVAPKNPVPRIRPLSEVNQERSMATENTTPPIPTMNPVDEFTAVEPALTRRPDPATLPQPDRNPAYTIIGPNEQTTVPQTSGIAEATSDIPTMTPVDSITAQAANSSTPSTQRSQRTTMASMIPISTPAAGQDSVVNIESVGFSEDYTQGVCQADGRDVCDAWPFNPVTIDLGTLCPADYADEVATMAAFDTMTLIGDRLPPVDSEAIINAFENHIYAFADDEICWDEIDWQSWEVIDPDMVASRMSDAVDTMATGVITDTRERAVQLAAIPTASPSMGTATLITESWVESNDSGDTVSADEDLGDFMKFMEMELVQVDSTDDDALPYPAIESLRTELINIRDEIRCLDDAVSATTDTEPDANDVSSARTFPQIDSAVEMNPVRIHDPAADLPVLVHEAPVVSETTRLIAEVEPLPSPSGSADAVLMVTMEEVEGTGHKTRSTKMGTMEPVEPPRPTLSSSIDEPKSK